MNEAPVLHHLDGRGVASVTFNRPAVGNAYDDTLIEGLHAALDAVAGHPEARVVVLRGDGRHFQAGADLGWVRAVAERSPAENIRASRRTAEAVQRLDTLALPTVALVQGGCFGGGTGIVAACDVVIAADDAVFAISETRWGLAAGIIVPQLVAAIGPRQVRRYALTGERFDAREARRIGLVHEVVPRSELEAAGQRLVDQFLQNAPGATVETKAIALEEAGLLATDTLERLVEQHATRRRSVEAAEGLASFREKRPARWYPGPAA